MSDFFKKDLTLTLTPGERWALTKGILLVIKTQDGNYEPEEMNPDDIFQMEEHNHLITALSKLNHTATLGATTN